MERQGESAGHINASKEPCLSDLVQDDQHALNTDTAAAAAAEDSAQTAADPSTGWDSNDVQDDVDSTPEHEAHVLDPLMYAAAAGDIPVLQQLLAELGNSAFGADYSGWTALHAAADSGQAQAIELLLAAGADVNAVAAYDTDAGYNSGLGETPLLVASVAGHAAVMQQLLAAGADVDAADVDGCTALYNAAEAGDGQVVQLLLDAGADVNAVNADRESPLHRAAEQGDAKLTQLLLTAGAVADGAREAAKATPLHYAALHGHLSTAKVLLAAGADPMAHALPSLLPDTWVTDKLTPLHLAARYGRLDVVLLLLSRTHASSASCAEVASDALCYTIRHGNLSCASLLIAAGAVATAEQQTDAMLAAVHAKDSAAVQQLLDAGVSLDVTWMGQPVLHQSAGGQFADKAVLQCLLAAGAAVTAQDSQGMTALMQAVLSDQLDLLNTLLAAIEAEGGSTAAREAVNCADKHGHTALRFAASPTITHAAEIIQVLLEAGADLDAADSNKWTVLHSATRQNMLEVMSQLLAAGADINAADQWGQTCLHHAIREQHLDALNVLLKAGAANVGDDHQRTPLHYAACHSPDATAVQLLLSAGAVVDAVDISGCTPLHDAAAVGREANTQVLLNAGAAPGRADNRGFTPLHHAAWKGSFEVARLLLDTGRVSADPADDAGDTPLHIAAREGHLQVVQLLLEHAAAPAAVNSSQHTALQEAILAGHLPVVQKLLLWAPLCAKDLRAAVTFAVGAKSSQQMQVYLLRQLYAADPHTAQAVVANTPFEVPTSVMLAMLEQLHAASSDADAVTAVHAAQIKELAQQRLGLQHVITQLAALQAKQPGRDLVQQQQQEQQQGQGRQLQQQQEQGQHGQQQQQGQGQQGRQLQQQQQ
jgi:ankyrin repeat protein